MKSFKQQEPKWPPLNLIYESHFSATEVIYEVFQNMYNFVESLYLQEVDLSQPPSGACPGIRKRRGPKSESLFFFFLLFNFSGGGPAQ